MSDKNDIKTDERLSDGGWIEVAGPQGDGQVIEASDVNQKPKSSRLQCEL